MKSIRLVTAAALATAAFFPVPASSQSPLTDTVDASLPTQLPRTARPTHYAITLTPHAKTLTFDATAAIDVEVLQPTRSLVLNAADLDIRSGAIRAAGVNATARVSTDENAQTATFDFGRILRPAATG